MKVTTNKKEQAFEPIELTITIENIDELRVFTGISSCNMSIPELFSNDKEIEVAKKILNKLHKKMHPLFKNVINPQVIYQ